MSDSKAVKVEEKKEDQDAKANREVALPSLEDFVGASAESLSAAEVKSPSDDYMHFLKLFNAATAHNDRDSHPNNEDRFAGDIIDPRILGVLEQKEIEKILTDTALTYDKLITANEEFGSTFAVSLSIPHAEAKSVEQFAVTLGDSAIFDILHDEKDQATIIRPIEDDDHPGFDARDPRFRPAAQPCLVYLHGKIFRLLSEGHYNMYNTIGDGNSRYLNGIPAKNCSPHVDHRTFRLNKKLNIVIVSDGVIDHAKPQEIADLTQGEQKESLSQGIISRLNQPRNPFDNATSIDTEFDLAQKDFSTPRIFGVFDGHRGYQVAELLKKGYIFTVKITMYQKALIKLYMSQRITAKEYIDRTAALILYLKRINNRIPRSTIQSKLQQLLSTTIYKLLQDNAVQLLTQADQKATAEIISLMYPSHIDQFDPEQFAKLNIIFPDQKLSAEQGAVKLKLLHNILFSINGSIRRELAVQLPKIVTLYCDTVQKFSPRDYPQRLHELINHFNRLALQFRNAGQGGIIEADIIYPLLTRQADALLASEEKDAKTNYECVHNMLSLLSAYDESGKTRLLAKTRLLFSKFQAQFSIEQQDAIFRKMYDIHLHNAKEFAELEKTYPDTQLQEAMQKYSVIYLNQPQELQVFWYNYCHCNFASYAAKLFADQSQQFMRSDDNTIRKTFLLFLLRTDSPDQCFRQYWIQTNDACVQHLNKLEAWLQQQKAEKKEATAINPILVAAVVPIFEALLNKFLSFPNIDKQHPLAMALKTYVNFINQHLEFIPEYADVLTTARGKSNIKHFLGILGMILSGCFGVLGIAALILGFAAANIVTGGILTPLAVIIFGFTATLGGLLGLYFSRRMANNNAISDQEQFWLGLFGPEAKPALNGVTLADAKKGITLADEKKESNTPVESSMRAPLLPYEPSKEVRAPEITPHQRHIGVM